MNKPSGQPGRKGRGTHGLRLTGTSLVRPRLELLELRLLLATSRSDLPLLAPLINSLAPLAEVQPPTLSPPASDLASFALDQIRQPSQIACECPPQSVIDQLAIALLAHDLKSDLGPGHVVPNPELGLAPTFIATDANDGLRFERPETGLLYLLHASAQTWSENSNAATLVINHQSDPPLHPILGANRYDDRLSQARDLPLDHRIDLSGQIAPGDPVDFYKLKLPNSSESFHFDMAPRAAGETPGFDLLLLDNNGKLIRRVNLDDGTQDVRLDVQALAAGTGTGATPPGSTIYLGIESIPSQTLLATPYEVMITRLVVPSSDPLNTLITNQAGPKEVPGSLALRGNPVGLTLAEVTESTTNPGPSVQIMEATTASDSALPTIGLIATSLPTRSAPALGGVLNQGNQAQKNQSAIFGAVDQVLGGEFPNATASDVLTAHELGGVPLRSVASHAIQLNFTRLRLDQPASKSFHSESDTSNPTATKESSLPSGPTHRPIAKTARRLGQNLGLQVGIGLLAAVALPEVCDLMAGQPRLSLRQRFQKLGKVR